MKTFGVVLANNGEDLLDEIIANDEDEAIRIFANKMGHEFYKDEWIIYHIGSAPYLCTDYLNIITVFAY
jgi:hypothetical protein